MVSAIDGKVCEISEANFLGWWLMSAAARDNGKSIPRSSSSALDNYLQYGFHQFGWSVGFVANS